MDDNEVWTSTKVDLEKIQCKDCKYQDVFEWEGKKIKLPGSCVCAKYPKNNSKPRGIIIPVYSIEKHETILDGKYIPCKYYKAQK